MRITYVNRNPGTFNLTITNYIYLITSVIRELLKLYNPVIIKMTIQKGFQTINIKL